MSHSKAGITLRLIQTESYTNYHWLPWIEAWLLSIFNFEKDRNWIREYLPQSAELSR